MVVYDLTGVHGAVYWFAGRSATKYGAAEVANLSFSTSPANIAATLIGGLTWNRVAGDGTVSNTGTTGTGIYTAHWTTSTVTLRLTVQAGPSKDEHTDVGLTVIPPTGLSKFIQKPGSGIKHDMGVASVGFLGWAYLAPKDVSFQNIQFGEGAYTATIANGKLNGWFAQKYPGGILHPPNGPINVGAGNITDGCRVLADDQIWGKAFPPPAYAIGWFEWLIPQRYSVGGGGWTTIDTSAHRYDIDAAGKMTVQKRGVGPFSKNMADATTNW